MTQEESVVQVLESQAMHDWARSQCRWVTATCYSTRLCASPRFLQDQVLCRLYWAVQWSWFAWVNALCNLSCKKSQEVAVSLPGRFLSRLCFPLCITMEAEPRIAKQYKCHHCCNCKKTAGEGDGGWIKSVSVLFWGCPEDREFVEKVRFGASYSTSNKLLLVVRHILTTGFLKCL